MLVGGTTHCCLGAEACRTSAGRYASHISRRITQRCRDIADELTTRGRNHVTIRIRPGGHEFPAADRELAYEFLASALG